MLGKLFFISVMILSFFTACSDRSDKKLSRDEAVAIVMHELNDSKRDVALTLGPDGERFDADVLGRYGPWNIAVFYGAKADEGIVPVFSDRADYILRLMPTTASRLRKVLHGLDTGLFAPVVSRVRLPEALDVGRGDTAAFYVRHAASAECEWEEAGGALHRVIPVKKTPERYEFTQKLLQTLPAGSYEVRCDFANDRANESDAVGVVLGHTRLRNARQSLQYAGGLEDRHCLPGQKMRFAARFEPKVLVGSIAYYLDGEAIDAEAFECPDDEDEHELFAVATAKDGSRVRSKTARLIVDPLPDELRFDGSEHVHF